MSKIAKMSCLQLSQLIELVNRRDISYKAKGLLCQLWSMPKGYNVTVQSLSRHNQDGTYSVQAGISELKYHSLLKITRGANGTCEWLLVN